MMINSVYDKAMENLRKRINVRLINNARDCKKYVSKPSFVSQKNFSKSLVAIHEIKLVKPINQLNPLDKPIYVGFSVLDLSKILMYDYHYNYIKRKFDAQLFFTDIGRLVYEIKTDDVYEDFYEDKNLFDFSDYTEDSKFFDLVNKKVIGKIEDELKGKIIREFVGLKSKMCSLVTVDNEENKKAKGVNKNAVKNIRHSEFIDVLLNKKMTRHKTKRIQSKLHKIGNYNVVKCLVLMIKAFYQLMEFIVWFTFIKI